MFGAKTKILGEPCRRQLIATSRKSGGGTMRPTRFLCVLTLVGAVIAVPSATAHADSPYAVNMHLHAHQQVEFDPNWLFEAEPCFVATGDLTEVFNGEAHALAAGIDDQGNFLPPLHVQETVEESVRFDPYDPALPTYTGHATVHVTNTEDSPHAGFTNTLVLRGTDGSHLVFHEDLHMLVKATGVVQVVDHQHASC
jgi:hypothetical protein